MNEIIGMMSQSLNASALRHKSISNNIANAETANFKPTKVVFEDLLKQEINHTFSGKQTNDKHITFGSSKSTMPEAKLVTVNQVFHNNGNGVDLDYEMTQLSKNALWYQALTYGLNEQLNLLKTSIRGGR